MYESRIAAGHLTVAARAGAAPALDVLGLRNLGGHGFLRARWYGEGNPDALRTLVVESAGGTPLAAIPTAPFGPAIAGFRKVPGSYWPLRSPLIAPECSTADLAQALAHPSAAASLGPVWRVGPARADDPAILRLVEAARRARWRVLVRPAGTSWVIDLDAARRQGGWPRGSTAARLARIERRLAAHGPVAWRHVRGAGWSDAVLEELAAVEAASWIAAETDGSGAKFLDPRRRAAWRAVLADPVLAEMLCATMLTVAGRAVAFSFDLDDGQVRYGIAGSFRSDFAKAEVGKLANHRAVSDAFDAGATTVDLGAGDSGYKRAMGASAGYDLVDLLFVRHRTAARLIAPLWGEALAHDARPARSLAHG
ncbi:MAG: GNAT family N-acetyltransferase [Erythrobacter sp.]|uniref:GNAT family N-acetyltransferase n=1 Tax=Erythrobacter sp. TaxID=1042 RepID=UPI0025F18B6B|nr:GNAT family N-acetyltransferase [Erythrobacter sp.]MCL9998839.1 GNAT family N-acetyltransferase [Erythrobacter sp.]